jgi:hypothetical protein
MSSIACISIRCNGAECEVSQTIACRSEDAVKAFEVAKAYLNSVECNHDQTERNEE